MAQLVLRALVWANLVGWAAGATAVDLDQIQGLDRPLDLCCRSPEVEDV